MTVHTPHENEYGGDWQREPITYPVTILNAEALKMWADLEQQETTQ